ncbi:hypothetical protein K8W59_18665 [Nocardioides rotundus]|uniref:hypothetical protein n=1 Tax=Nocardioides rotundus TaxID=1774216 RepID=UPI001CBF85BE|nr:hypothetical protein [Nocardioides rotundus]UAL29735.1 hypothetical protein K8W59_18665 [Nocardioides rotundus]
MRTTITLDPDVAALLERDMRTRDVPFKRAVNEAIRRGLGAETAQVDVVFPSADLGQTSYELDHATALAAALEDEELVRKLNEGR